MTIKEYSFNLPSELIAQYPSDTRGESRLLILDKKSGHFRDSHISEFPDVVEDGSILVINNSKVRKARVYGESESGSSVEFLFTHVRDDGTWNAMVQKSKRQRIGKTYRFTSKDGSCYQATIVGEEQGEKIVSFSHPIDEQFFQDCGHVPLPPYIKRDDTIEDESRYQTVYAQESGSVAAPTAGLHFTQEILDSLLHKGVTIVPVTLHVGAGTFLPIRTEHIEDHVMHLERYTIPQETARIVTEGKKEGRPIVAIGTTSVRTLESAYDSERELLEAKEGSTRLFIFPPFQFRVVDKLFTNFHTPESTLLVLVSTFAGKECIARAYEHAVAQRYRFFSYGDAMYIC